MLDLCYNCYYNVNYFICRVVVNADAPYIKMVTEQFDRCHGILLQYVDFLSSAVSPATAYAQLVPSLEELVHTYHLEPEVFDFPFLFPLLFNLVLLHSSTIWISSLSASLSGLYCWDLNLANTSLCYCCFLFVITLCI